MYMCADVFLSSMLTKSAPHHLSNMITVYFLDAFGKLAGRLIANVRTYTGQHWHPSFSSIGTGGHVHTMRYSPIISRVFRAVALAIDMYMELRDLISLSCVLDAASKHFVLFWQRL